MNVKELRSRGIELTLIGNSIHYKAREGLLDRTLLMDMHNHKQELIDQLRQLEEGDRVLDRWRRDSIPQWKAILAESIDEVDEGRRDYAIWMLREVLGYDER